MKTPQVTWLRSFEAAARRGSFSAAADDLGLTPAAVSQQIRLLEKHLGAQLFERLPKGVVLTDTGQAYAQPIRKSFSEMQAATEGLFGSRSRKTVKVRSSISYAALVLAPQLGAFRTTYPDIDVQLSTTVWSDRIETDDIDVDIRYGNGEWDDGTIWRLGDEQASVVCSPQFANSFGDTLNFEALYGSRVVQIIGSEVEWVRMLDHYDLDLAPPVAWLKADSSLMALQIILSGLGSAIVMERFSRSFVAQGLLVEPLAYRLPILQSYFLVVTDKAERRDEVRSFCRWLAGW
jgi:LysR family transcriptional regulator, glycine cleavage system transcriptional activator